MKSVGVLLINTGTPNALTADAVRLYLQSFLEDPMVVSFPQFIWRPLLKYIILPKRIPYSLHLYEKIWTSEGSPLYSNMKKLVFRLQDFLNKQSTDTKFIVEMGMSYSNPSISNGLHALQKQPIDQLIVLPLFPQYSKTTTGSIAQKIKTLLSDQPYHFISNYYNHPAYINAWVKKIENELTLASNNLEPPPRLLFSFHGIPQYCVNHGDPYLQQCQETTFSIIQRLKLNKDQWGISFQSRLGYTRWLKPYTNEVLKSLPKKGIKHLIVACPGFGVDCLETLEEIQMRGQDTFLKAGGEKFQYISALNDELDHIQALAAILALIGTAPSPQRALPLS